MRLYPLSFAEKELGISLEEKPDQPTSTIRGFCIIESTTIEQMKNSLAADYFSSEKIELLENHGNVLIRIPDGDASALAAILTEIVPEHIVMAARIDGEQFSVIGYQNETILFTYYYPERPGYALPFVDQVKGFEEPSAILKALGVPDRWL